MWMLAYVIHPQWIMALGLELIVGIERWTAFQASTQTRSSKPCGQSHVDIETPANLSPSLRHEVS